MQPKLQRFERQRRRQVIGLTIAFGLLSAALAAVAIYFVYQTMHLRM
jgi:hypothetical protein